MLSGLRHLLVDCQGMWPPCRAVALACSGALDAHLGVGTGNCGELCSQGSWNSVSNAVNPNAVHARCLGCHVAVTI